MRNTNTAAQSPLRLTPEFADQTTPGFAHVIMVVFFAYEAVSHVVHAMVTVWDVFTALMRSGSTIPSYGEVWSISGRSCGDACR